MTLRAHRAWKDAWFSFRSLIWNTLGNPGWCWLSMALHRYHQEEEKILDALQSEFDDLSWWNHWRNWNEKYEQVVPTSDDLRWGRHSSFIRDNEERSPSQPHLRTV